MAKLKNIMSSIFSQASAVSASDSKEPGCETVAFCEIDPFCRRVLAKHWPRVPCYDDVRTLTADRLAADGIAIDAICGGFPCQDISEAGRGEGIAGARSGLWTEYSRLIGELRPRIVVVENVSALLSRGMGKVLGDLATLGFDAEWHCIPAFAVGAPHERDRVWLVAYPCPPERGADASSRDGLAGAISIPQRQEGPGRSELGCADVANTDARGHEGSRCEMPRRRSLITRGALSADGQWASEPELDRVANGIPNWSHRVASLGNAVVPQIPEIIGKAIMNCSDENTA